MPSDDRVSFPLDQAYVREWGSALSVDEQVPLVAVEVPVRTPPPVVET